MTLTPEGRLVIGREINPYEVSVLALSLAYGLMGTVRFDLAATSIRMYPSPGGRVFLVLLAFGALVALTGLLNRSRWGLKVQAGGQTLLACLGAGYALWTPFSVGTRGIGLLLFLGILLFAPSAFLAVRLRRYLRRAEQLERARKQAYGHHDGARPEDAT